MAGFSWYSVCDGFTGYYAVRIRPEDIPKTMFKTPFGTYAYTVMPFGLKNAPHTYSRVTYKAYEKLIGKTLETYIDDTATYSNTFEQHLIDLRRTFECTEAASLKLKAKKCAFMYPEVEFVGHLVGAYGIRVMPGKVDKIRGWPIPRDKTEVRSFLGLVGYYRRFIRDFAKIVVPLTELTKKAVEYEWNEERQTAFTTLKTALSSAPVIAKPNFCAVSRGTSPTFLLTFHTHHLFNCRYVHRRIWSTMSCGQKPSR